MIIKRSKDVAAGVATVLATADSVVVLNTGTHDIYVGDVGVSDTTGMLIAPGDDFSFDLAVNQPLYGYSPLGTVVTLLQTIPHDQNNIPQALQLTLGSGGGTPPSGLLTKVATTVGSLGVGDFNGQLGIIRIGTWPNVHEEILKWNSATSKWVGDPFTVITQSDTWSIDLLDKPVLTNWGWIINPNPQSGTNTFLNGAQDLNTITAGTITVNSTVGFATAGTIYCRGNRITYTGKTGTTFTGCVNTFAGLTGAVPANSYVTQGSVGGFGFVTSAVEFAAQMFAAGLTLQEKFCGFLCGSLDTKALTVAPYWNQYDSGDGSIAPSFNSTPVGGMGFSTSLVGTTVAGGNLGQERSFTWAENDWSVWPIVAAPTKKFLVPTVYGKMAAGAVDSGQIVDGTLRMRWVQP